MSLAGQLDPNIGAAFWYLILVVFFGGLATVGLKWLSGKVTYATDHRRAEMVTQAVAAKVTESTDQALVPLAVQMTELKHGQHELRLGQDFLGQQFDRLTGAFSEHIRANSCVREGCSQRVPMDFPILNDKPSDKGDE